MPKRHDEWTSTRVLPPDCGRSPRDAAQRGVPSYEGVAVLAAGVGRVIGHGTDAFGPPLAWERVLGCELQGLGREQDAGRRHGASAAEAVWNANLSAGIAAGLVRRVIFERRRASEVAEITGRVAGDVQADDGEEHARTQAKHGSPKAVQPKTPFAHALAG